MQLLFIKKIILKHLFLNPANATVLFRTFPNKSNREQNLSLIVKLFCITLKAVSHAGQYLCASFAFRNFSTRKNSDR